MFVSNVLRVKIIIIMMTKSGKGTNLVHIVANFIICLHYAAAGKVQIDAAVQARLVATLVQLLPLLLQGGPLLRGQPLVRVYAEVVRLVVNDLSSLLAGDVVLEEPVLVGEGQLVGRLQGLVVPVLGPGGVASQLLKQFFRLAAVSVENLLLGLPERKSNFIKQRTWY